MISAFSLIADAAATPASSPLSNPVIPMVAMLVIFYFLLIRPQRKQQKELQDRISTLKTGDKVVTSGGIHGIVANVKEGNILSLKIADNVKIEIDKSAIATIQKEPAAKTA
jgi:preprotein translocase subunit YajC